MADAYQCDRCEKLIAGLPPSRVGFDELQKDGEYGEMQFTELCPDCQLEFLKWLWRSNG